jgi:hypothetical protein
MDLTLNIILGFPELGSHLDLIHTMLNIEPEQLEKYFSHLDIGRGLSPSTVRESDSFSHGIALVV